MTPEELLQLKSLLLNDAVYALRRQNAEHQARIETIVSDAVAKVNSFDERVSKLEHERAILIRGAALYASIMACFIGGLYGWIRSKIHFN